MSGHRRKRPSSGESLLKAALYNGSAPNEGYLNLPYFNSKIACIKLSFVIITRFVNILCIIYA